MTTIPALSTASEVLALVAAGTVTQEDARTFFALRVARKERDGLAPTATTLNALAGLIGAGERPSAHADYLAWRSNVVKAANALALAAGGVPPKAAPRAASKPKASAKGKAKTAAKPASKGKANAPSVGARLDRLEGLLVKFLEANIKA
jgi:hypothetical protein